MQLPDLAAHDTLPKLLRLNAERWPHEVAVREKDFGSWKHFSWADMSARVRELASGLMALGILRFFGHGRYDVVINKARYDIDLFKSPDRQSIRSYFPVFKGLA